MAQFTLVRHSGYAVGGDPALDDAVEVLEITLHQVYAVRTAGGVIFPTHPAALRAQDELNHPLGAGRSNASTHGHFSTLRLAGAEIYVPDSSSRSRCDSSETATSTR